MSDVGLGLVGYLGYGKETTYGTAVTRTHFVEINDESFETSEGRIESQALARVGILNTKMVQGGIGISGGFSFDAQYAGWERLLLYALGSVVSSQPDVTSNNTVWDHAYKIADTLPTGLTVEVFRDTSGFTTEPNKAFLFKGCVISSMTLSCGVDDLLKVRCELFGQDEARVAKSTPTYDTSKLAVYHQGTVKYNSDDKEAEEFSITINNALEPRPKLGSRLGRQPKRSGKLDVSGSFTMEFKDWAEYDDFRNATERVMQIQFIGDTITGAYKNTITMDINVAVITGHRVMNTSPGRLRLEISFKAYRTTTINEIIVTMRNATAPSVTN